MFKRYTFTNKWDFPQAACSSDRMFNKEQQNGGIIRFLGCSKPPLLQNNGAGPKRKMENAKKKDCKRLKVDTRRCYVRLKKLKSCFPTCTVGPSDFNSFPMKYCQQCERWCHSQCFVSRIGPSTKCRNICFDCSKMLAPKKLETTTAIMSPSPSSCHAESPIIPASPEGSNCNKWKWSENVSATDVDVLVNADVDFGSENDVTKLRAECEKLKHLNVILMRQNGSILQQNKQLKYQKNSFVQNAKLLNAKVDGLNTLIKASKKEHIKKIKRLNRDLNNERKKVTQMNNSHKEQYVTFQKSNNSIVLRRVAPTGVAPNKDSFKRGKSMSAFCSNLSKDDDNYLYCGFCGKDNLGECSIHGPMMRINDSIVLEDDPLRADHSVPYGFSIDVSSLPEAGKGVWTIIDVDENTVFGPYVGTIVDVKSDAAKSSLYCWDIRINKKPSYCIDGSDVAKSNWLRYVNCANYEQQQNLMAFQYKRQIFYRAIKKIPAGKELLVWYGLEYAKLLGLNSRAPGPEACEIVVCSTGSSSSSSPSNMIPLTTTSQLSLKCAICNAEFVSQNVLDEHMVSKHTRYTCLECEKRFKLFVDALAHKSETGHVGIERLSLGLDGRVLLDPVPPQNSQNLPVNAAVMEKMAQPIIRLPPTLACSYCTAIFTNKHELDSHMESQHRHYIGASLNSQLKSDVRCTTCQWWFPSELIERHVAGAHGSVQQGFPVVGGPEVIQLEDDDVRANDVIGLPSGLTVLVCPLTGVCQGVSVDVAVPVGTVFGPCKSKVESMTGYRPDDLTSIAAQCVTCRETDTSPSNWLRHIRSVDEKLSANLEVFRFKEHVFYRAILPLASGSELLVCRESQKTSSAVTISSSSTTTTTNHITRTEPRQRSKLTVADKINGANCRPREAATTATTLHPLQCQKCLMQFSSNYRLCFHLDACDLERRYGECCRHCNKHFANGAILYRHLLYRHPGKITESTQQLALSDKRCRICSWWFSDAVVLFNHMIQKHPDEPISAEEGKIQNEVPVAPPAKVEKVPSVLRLCRSKLNTIMGVKASTDISEGALFGPCKGRVIRVDIPPVIISDACWQVVRQMEARKIIIGQDTAAPQYNWLRYINFSKTIWNLEPVIYKTHLFYRATKPILSDTELLVRCEGNQKSATAYEMSGRQAIDVARGRKTDCVDGQPPDTIESESCSFVQQDLQSLLKSNTTPGVNSPYNTGPPLAYGVLTDTNDCIGLTYSEPPRDAVDANPHRCRLCDCFFENSHTLQIHNTVAHGVRGCGNDGLALSISESLVKVSVATDGQDGYTQRRSLVDGSAPSRLKTISVRCSLCSSLFLNNSMLCWHKIRTHHCCPFALERDGLDVSTYEVGNGIAIALPPGLTLRKSSFQLAVGMGVWNTFNSIFHGTIFGPFKKMSKVTFSHLGLTASIHQYKRLTVSILRNTVFAKELAVNDGWLQLLKWTTDARKANLIAIQYDARAFYCVFKVIPPNTELIAWDPTWTDVQLEQKDGGDGLQTTGAGDDGAPKSSAEPATPSVDVGDSREDPEIIGERDHGGDNSSLCDCCSAMFKSPTELRKHQLDKHDIVMITYSCIECQQEFDSHDGVTSHQLESGHVGFGTTLVGDQDVDAAPVSEESRPTNASVAPAEQANHAAVRNDADKIPSAVQSMTAVATCVATLSTKVVYRCNDCRKIFIDHKAILDHHNNSDHVCGFHRLTVNQIILTPQKSSTSNVPLTVLAPNISTTSKDIDSVSALAVLPVATPIDADASLPGKASGISPAVATSVKCDVCQKSFASQGRLSKHRATEHPSLSSRTHQAASNRYSCRRCLKSWTSVILFREHCARAHPGTLQLCDNSHLVQRAAEELSSHETPIEEQVEKVSGENDLATCTINQHNEAGKEPQKSHECHVCPAASFLTAHALRTHQFQVHAINQIYTCSQCTGQFRDRNALMVHQNRRRHTGAQINLIRPVVTATTASSCIGVYTDATVPENFQNDVPASDAGTIAFDPSVFLNVENGKAAEEIDIRDDPFDVAIGGEEIPTEGADDDTGAINGSLRHVVSVGEGSVGSDCAVETVFAMDVDAESSPTTASVETEVTDSTKTVEAALEVDPVTSATVENSDRINADVKSALNDLFLVLLPTKDLNGAVTDSHSTKKTNGDYETDATIKIADVAAEDVGIDVDASLASSKVGESSATIIAGPGNDKPYEELPNFSQGQSESEIRLSAALVSVAKRSRDDGES